MMKKNWENKLNENIDKIITEMGSNSYIGPINNGLYQIGNGCFTGKEGYQEFIKQLDNEIK